MSGFNLQEASTFEREVTFSVPKGKGWRKVTINCEFKLDGGDDTKKPGLRVNRDLLGDVLVGARGLANTDGSDADPATDGVRMVIAHEVASAAVARAYVDAINEGAERKN